MKITTRTLPKCCIACFLMIIPLVLAGTAAAVSMEKLPVINGEKAVATVGDVPITLAEFKRALATSHAGTMAAPGEKGQNTPRPGKIEYSGIIDRLVDIRLIVIEARNIGLDQQAQIRGALEIFTRETLIKLLLEQHVEDIRVEDGEIEPLYQERVREWKIRTALFKNKDAALKTEADIRAGADFDTTMNKAATDRVAEVDPEAQFVKNADLSLPVARLVSQMKVGDVSTVVTVGQNKFVLFRLAGMRYPEQIDRKAWDDARRQVLTEKKVQAAKDYFERLKKQSATIDEALLASLDFESETPGFDALRSDTRVLVKIKGKDPITVADLTLALEKKFFHGIKQAIASKRLNNAKTVKLEEMLHDRVLLMEAHKKGLDRTEEFKLRVKAYEDALIFGQFIEKVIAPDIKLQTTELKKYYQEHIDDFTAPRMIRIRSLTFGQKDAAIDAIDKLTRGTDFEWLAANAEGQVNPNMPGLVRFDGRLLTQRGLPRGAQNVVADAGTGDYRMFSDEILGIHYVLRIDLVIVPGPRSFAEVKKEIAENLFAEKVKAAIDTWTEQLSRHYPVNIFLTTAD